MQNVDFIMTRLKYIIPTTPITMMQVLQLNMSMQYAVIFKAARMTTFGWKCFLIFAQNIDFGVLEVVQTSTHNLSFREK